MPEGRRGQEERKRGGEEGRRREEKMKDCWSSVIDCDECSLAPSSPPHVNQKQTPKETVLPLFHARLQVQALV